MLAIQCSQITSLSVVSVVTIAQLETIAVSNKRSVEVPYSADVPMSPLGVSRRRRCSRSAAKTPFWTAKRSPSLHLARRSISRKSFTCRNGRSDFSASDRHVATAVATWSRCDDLSSTRYSQRGGRGWCNRRAVSGRCLWLRQDSCRDYHTDTPHPTRPRGPRL